MPITITVETGDIVADANAYVSVDDVRAYASNRGVALSDDNDTVAAMLIKATDYLEMFAGKYPGTRTDPATQVLQWPREDAYINDELIADDAIPRQLIQCQCALVMAEHSGIDILPNPSLTDFVIEEKVGPLTTKYATPVIGAPTVVLTQVNALLRQLFGSNGSMRMAVYRG